MSAAQTTMFGVEVMAPSPQALDLSQWFTPAWLAERMAALALRNAPVEGEDWHTHVSVLEPSAGAGALLKACAGEKLRDVVDTGIYVGIDIDARLCTEHGWTHADYLTHPAPDERYGVGLSNPPYEAGLDGRFVEKMMDECETIVALVRLVFFAGKDRYERVWSRVEAGEWSLATVAFLPERPDFELAGIVQDQSARTDFVVLHLVRGDAFVDTKFQWWREGQ